MAHPFRQRWLHPAPTDASLSLSVQTQTLVLTAGCPTLSLTYLYSTSMADLLLAFRNSPEVTLINRWHAPSDSTVPA